MDKGTHDVRYEGWIKIIQECMERPDGMSAKQWLLENNVNEKQYYYWLRKFRKDSLHEREPSNEVSFAEVAMPYAEIIPIENTMEMLVTTQQKSAAILRKGNLTIEITNDISEHLLTRLLQEVAHA